MSLRKHDLNGLIKHVFEVDSYKSKLGNDEEIVVLSFTVDSKEPALDLENFVEMGYSFVIDADVTEGETDDGDYKVFVELERNRHVPDQIMEILDGIKKLASIDNFRFRYYKSFKSQEATIENLIANIPLDKESYNISISENKLNNFSNFFSNSFADEVSILNESIKFKRTFCNPISFNIVNSGPAELIYALADGPVLLENKDMAEVMFLTKHIGNYNITKVGNTFIFENANWAVSLERIE